VSKVVEEVRSGLTWRSFSALLYASIVMMPATIYANLVAGIGMGAFLFPAIGYVVAFLFVEIARLSGRPLTKQEVFIIWSCSLVATETPFVGTVLHNYYRSLAPITWAFNTNDGRPLPLAIPDWFAPPPWSIVRYTRTFFHPDFLIPSAAFLLAMMAAGKIVDPALGFICYQLYVVEKNLPFPSQIIAAETCTTLAEREESKVRVLMIVTLISSIYALLTYFIPFVTDFSVQILPIPWVDLNTSIEAALPGASFGFGTDLIIFAIGLILPFPTVIGMFIGSFGTYFIGNYILVKLGMFQDWRPGMSITLAYQRSVLSTWAFTQIGLAIAAAAIPMVIHFKVIARAFKGLTRLSEATKKAGVLPLKIVLPLFLIGSTIIFVLCAWLTDFPLILLAFLVYGWSFLASLIAARALGVSGFYITVPYVTETTIITSGYKDIDIWFAPLVIYGGGAYWSGWFKIADLTHTTKMSYVKGHLLIFSIAWLFSLIYMQLFWSIAPIPSVMYPATGIQWPVTVITRSLWITGKVGFGSAQQLILGSFALGTIIEITCSVTHIPFHLMSVVVGTLTPVPSVLICLFGGITAKVLIKKYGMNWWSTNRSLIAAGVFLGESMILTMSVAATMIIKALWILPY